MNALVRSYLAYAKGEGCLSPWALLRPLGWVASGVVSLRGFCYDHGLFESLEPPLPVISVGNLTTGGTNKTPFVEMLILGLRERGVRPGIISRGYGGKTKCPVVLFQGQGSRGLVGDEPLLLSNRFPDIPIAVSRDRLRDVELLTHYGVDVVVADDAFQHRRLHRDVDVVLIDATCPFGNGSQIPSGILREPPRALERAHLVAITKADQVSSRNLRRLQQQLRRWVPSERLFCSRLDAPEWFLWDGQGFAPWRGKVRGLHGLIFSAIGNPASFQRTVTKEGLAIARALHFKDHHRFTLEDMEKISQALKACGADGVCCTEKDIYNLPEGWEPPFPLLVPRIRTDIDDESRFWRTLTQCLRPRLVVASNGYGEDAIGAVVAQRLRDRFPSAQVQAFPLVGLGTPYRERTIEIAAPTAETPSGGLIKYRFRDLVTDLRSGLLSLIRRQLAAWGELRGRCRTVVAVGDVYLLCHALLGQGCRPLMVATAKTVLLHGHWRLESFLYRRGVRCLWTRDEATAQELQRSGVRALFRGNPIMDLAWDNKESTLELWGEGRRVLLLPGSRLRAYRDVGLLLDTVEIMGQRERLSLVLVVAPSISLDRLIQAAQERHWTLEAQGPAGALSLRSLKVLLYHGEVGQAAPGAELLIGLGGTANQVCAGLGVPVLSVLEKAKLVQKKLLGDAELLVAPDPAVLASEALALLADPQRRQRMAQAGRERLGGPGAVESVVDYAARELGWETRCRLYRQLSGYCDGSRP